MKKFELFYIPCVVKDNPYMPRRKNKLIYVGIVITILFAYRIDLKNTLRSFNLEITGELRRTKENLSYISQFRSLV